MEGGKVRGLLEEDGDSEGGETLAGSYLVAALRGGATLTENNTLYLLQYTSIHIYSTVPVSITNCPGPILPNCTVDYSFPVSSTLHILYTYESFKSVYAL